MLYVFNGLYRKQNERLVKSNYIRILKDLILFHPDNTIYVFKK